MTFDEISPDEYRVLTLSKRELRRDALYDLAADRPDGFTVTDVHQELGWPYGHIRMAIRDLRLLMEDDTISLVCDPQGKGERWLYRLVGTLEEGSPWIANRERDMLSRLQTVHAVASSIVNATDGRTITGRKAALTKRIVGRLLEDLSDFTQGNGAI